MKASTLALCLLALANATRVDVDNQHSLLSEAEASTIGAQTADRLSHQQEPTTPGPQTAAGWSPPWNNPRTTPQNYLVAVLCTALAYFMNFEANFKSINPNDHPAEDSKLGLDEDVRRKYVERIRAQGGIDRWTRIAANQLENFPFHLWIFWSALMAGAGSQGRQGAVNCFVAYMIFRFLFVICYIYALSPWRTIIFLFSQFAVIGGACFGVSAATSALPGVSAETAAFRSVAMAIAILFFLMNFFARLKSINPNNHPAEDEKVGRAGEKARRAYEEARQAEGPLNRWERIAVNQAEFIPVSVAVYWGAYSVGASPVACTCLFGAYFVLRFLFIFCYLFSVQPFRTLFWFVSNVLTLVVGIMGIAASAGDLSCTLMMASTFVIWFLNITAVVKALDPNNHPAEDSKIGIDEERKDQFKKRVEEQGGVDRWTRISANQLENFPIHLLVLWGVATIAENRAAIAYCFVAYTTFRILFVICYLFALTPWRTLMFLFTQISMATTLVLGVYHAKDAHAEGAWMPLAQ